MNAKISQQALNLARAYGTITNTPDATNYQTEVRSKNNEITVDPKKPTLTDRGYVKKTSSLRL